jgi:hypothetical protein
MPSFLRLKNQAQKMRKKAAELHLLAESGVADRVEALPSGFLPVGPTRLRGGWVALPRELRDVECPVCDVGWTANLLEEVATCWLCGLTESTQLLADQYLACQMYDRYLEVLEQRTLTDVGWHRRLAMELVSRTPS